MTQILKDIQNIENRYGLILFRMALSHLIDVGVRNLDDENVEECIKQIEVQGEEDRVNGIIKIMTPAFERDIVRCAAELASFQIWDLVIYIKKYVVVE